MTDWNKIVLAYAPLWAVGTGKVASPEIAQQMHHYIRNWLSNNLTEELANEIRIIYDGSVNETNAEDLICQPDIDGFVVGKFGIEPQFAKIVTTVSDQHGKSAEIA